MRKLIVTEFISVDGIAEVERLPSVTWNDEMNAFKEAELADSGANRDQRCNPAQLLAVESRRSMQLSPGWKANLQNKLACFRTANDKLHRMDGEERAA